MFFASIQRAKNGIYYNLVSVASDIILSRVSKVLAIDLPIVSSSLRGQNFAFVQIIPPAIPSSLIKIRKAVSNVNKSVDF